MRFVQHSMVNVPYAALYVSKVHYFKYQNVFKKQEQSIILLYFKVQRNKTIIIKKKYKLMQSPVDCIISEQYSCPTTENTAVNYIGWANLSSVNMTTHNLKGRTRVSKWLRRIVPSVTLGKWAGCFLLLRQPDGQKTVGIDPDQLAVCWSRSVNISSEYLMSLTTQERKTELRSRGVACSC